MKARLIGPEAELGDVRDGITFQGQKIGREWAPVEFSPEALAKARANRYIELDEGRAAKKPADPAAAEAEREADTLEAQERATVSARLSELGVDHDPEAPIKTLKGKLDKAEKAAAKADEEADAAAAKAEELRAQAHPTDQPEA